ncbi:Gfo/Idh/MocA family protein [Vibrio barjaei]|uniref:Gfo/Idh/MocA family protein n=1 Tax=Vibrio barjaei TaxID=1676683 RepID=UPI0022843045|nr:Gfo/Idh/MocA family oxidoreductase [Vibrio barjaei]MCY9872534.1 Gfo/Idh/MocA family oxidoreductase [Vibrio barjaei]
MKKVAVVGFGNIATRHRRNLRFLFPNARIFGMSASGRSIPELPSDCDEVVTSIEELAKNNVEMAIIASPAPFHSRQAIQFIRAKIPVLIEKPVTTSVDDGEQLLQEVKRYKTPVAVGYCLRYLSSASEVKQRIEKEELGKIYNAFIEIGQYLPDWRPNKDYRGCVSARKELGGGALFELSHEIDYCQWLLGPLTLKFAEQRSVGDLGIDVEDCVDIIATSKQSTLVTIHLDFLQRKAYRRCRLIGEKGVLEWDLINNELIKVTPETREVLYSSRNWDKNQMYINMLLDFVSLINGQACNAVSLKESLQTVRFIEAVKANYPLESN